jgi:hypothetical protein
MSEEVDEFSDDVDDEEVNEVIEDEKITEVIEHFELLESTEQMRKAFEGIKLSLKKKEKEEKFATKVEKKVEAMKAKFAAPSAHIFLLLNGNSVEKISSD